VEASAEDSAQLGDNMTTLEFLLAKAKEKKAVAAPHGEAIEIPGVGRDDLAAWFGELGFTAGVEIGVKEGIYSEKLCKANPALHLSSVDPWLVREEYHDSRGQRVFDNYEARARKRLAPYDCEIIKEKSCDALRYFGRRSLDFAYIDGHHNLFNVIHDIVMWSALVRPGGIIAGHDYVRYTNQAMHVQQGVRAYVDSYQIKPWFLLGRRDRKEYRDRHRSFLWVRPGYEADMRDYDPTLAGLAEMEA
jgi:hypothetical protein